MTRFQKTPMTLIDFVEKQAEAKFDGIMSDQASLARETHLTFAFIATALSAVFGYGLSVIKSDPHANQEWAVLCPLVALLIHLFVLGWLLMTDCMRARGMEHKGNEPDNILTDENRPFPLDAIREAQLENLGKAILMNAERNRKTARGLNRARRGILFAPFTFLAAWAAALAWTAACS
jgi:hypothetical protein